MTDRPRRVRLDLAYDGTRYRGWQIQPEQRTVQGTLGSLLSRLHGGRPVAVRGAGRTDSGVHARGQVADVRVDVGLADAALVRALRRMSPPDLSVLACRTVADGFDARRHAVSKTYAYRIDRSAAGDPFSARYALHHPRPLDRDAVERALSRLPGRRDWSGFAGAACEIEDRVRTVTEARCAEDGAERLRFVFSADGFLNHMVRNLVGTILEIGRGRFPPDRVDRILEAGDRSLGGPTAPPHGLCLESVRYADGTMPGRPDRRTEED